MYDTIFSYRHPLDDHSALFRTDTHHQVNGITTQVTPIAAYPTALSRSLLAWSEQCIFDWEVEERVQYQASATTASSPLKGSNGDGRGKAASYRTLNKHPHAYKNGTTSSSLLGNRMLSISAWYSQGRDNRGTHIPREDDESSLEADDGYQLLLQSTPRRRSDVFELRDIKLMQQQAQQQEQGLDTKVDERNDNESLTSQTTGGSDFKNKLPFETCTPLITSPAYERDATFELVREGELAFEEEDEDPDYEGAMAKYTQDSTHSDLDDGDLADGGGDDYTEYTTHYEDDDFYNGATEGFDDDLLDQESQVLVRHMLDAVTSNKASPSPHHPRSSTYTAYTSDVYTPSGSTLQQPQQQQQYTEPPPQIKTYSDFKEEMKRRKVSESV